MGKTALLVTTVCYVCLIDSYKVLCMGVYGHDFINIRIPHNDRHRDHFGLLRELLFEENCFYLFCQFWKMKILFYKKLKQTEYFQNIALFLFKTLQKKISLSERVLSRVNRVR